MDPLPRTPRTRMDGTKNHNVPLNNSSTRMLLGICRPMGRADLTNDRSLPIPARRSNGHSKSLLHNSRHVRRSKPIWILNKKRPQLHGTILPNGIHRYTYRTGRQYVHRKHTVQPGSVRRRRIVVRRNDSIRNANDQKHVCTSIRKRRRSRNPYVNLRRLHAIRKLHNYVHTYPKYHRNYERQPIRD